jgi:hypothetical protein
LDGASIGDIKCAWVLEQGTITIGGTRYLVSREALISGAFFLEADGKRLVTADSRARSIDRSHCRSGESRSR